MKLRYKLAKKEDSANTRDINWEKLIGNRFTNRLKEFIKKETINKDTKTAIVYIRKQVLFTNTINEWDRLW